MAEELNKPTELTEDLSDFDFQYDIFSPMAQKNMLYSSNQMKFFNENKIDRAPLFGQQPYPYVPTIEDVKLNAQASENLTNAGKDVIDFFKAAPGYIMDTGENYLDRMTVAAMNMEDIGINLKPFAVKYLQESKGPLSFLVAGMDYETEYQKAITKSKELKERKQEFETNLEAKEDLFQSISGVIAQDFPAYMAVKKITDPIPFLPKFVKTALNVGISGGLSFSSDDTLDNLFFDSVMVDKLKEAYDILPNTPEEELTEKLYQIFEYTATTPVIDGIIKSFKFLKKFPKYVSEKPVETSAAIGAGAAITPTEAEGSPIAKLGQKFIEKGGRRLLGVSQETAGKVPTTFEQQVGAKQFENLFNGDPTIQSFKVDDSFGKFGDNVERNFDIELLVGENFNDQNVLSKAVDFAEKNNQEAILYSKSTSSQNPKANPAFSINFKEPLYYKDAQKQIDDVLNKYNINEGYTAKTGLIDFKSSKVMELPKPNQEIINKAKAKFKPTTNMSNAGYILPDGTLLDLGRSYGSSRGGSVEHRDVAAIALGGQKPGNAEQMFEFMKQTGAIRISPFQNRLFGQTYYKPTKQQVRAFEKFNKEGGYEEMVIDGVFPGEDMEKQLFQTNTANRIFEVAPGEKFNAAEFEKFFDPQALSSKQYAGVRSIYVPEFSSSDPKKYMKSILAMENDLKGSDIIGSANLEFFETNAINRKDYGKYK